MMYLTKKKQFILEPDL